MTSWKSISSLMLLLGVVNFVIPLLLLTYYCCRIIVVGVVVTEHAAVVIVVAFVVAGVFWRCLSMSILLLLKLWTFSLCNILTHMTDGTLWKTAHWRCSWPTDELFCWLWSRRRIVIFSSTPSRRWSFPIGASDADSKPTSSSCSRFGSNAKSPTSNIW